MADTPNDYDLFARVENHQIVEYPVYRIHIVSRSHPIEWYTPVTVVPALPAPQFYRNQEKVELKNDGQVLVTYEAVPLSLEQLLQTVYADVIPEEGQEAEVFYSQVDPALAYRIYLLAGNFTMDKLNEFVQTRDYDSMLSLVSYKDSQIPKFSAEAARGIELRDQIWTAMVGFFQQLQQDLVPVPRSLGEVEAIMPALTWGDEEPETP